jgi:glycosyltransferase involved in cell wall biosynthesis
LASSKASLRLQLTVAGEFVEAAERREFENRVAEPDLQISATEQRGINLHPSSENVRQEPAVRYVGFISGAEKHRALAESDCLCFPTYYHAESFGLVLIEAMALGLPIVATRWRSIPELFPPEYPGLVEIRSPAGIGEAINRVVFQPTSQGLRDLFVQNFSLPRHLTNLAEALISVERAAT